MPPPLREEWNNHASTFARTWLVAMRSKRRLLLGDVPETSRLRREITRVAVAGLADETEAQAIQRAMAKDFHLLEAALATDKRVISLDEKVRTHFCRAASEVKAIKAVIWVNPGLEGVTAIVWIEENARAERKRRLDCQPISV